MAEFGICNFSDISTLRRSESVTRKASRSSFTKGNKRESSVSKSESKRKPNDTDFEEEDSLSNQKTNKSDELSEKEDAPSSKTCFDGSKEESNNLKSTSLNKYNKEMDIDKDLPLFPTPIPSPISSSVSNQIFARFLY